MILCCPSFPDQMIFYIYPEKRIQATTPSVIMSKKEDLDKLEKAIDQLKPDYREVIVLAKIDGLSYKEIADIVGTVMSRLSRVRRRLQKTLSSKMNRRTRDEL